jgi:hypothetical protein
MAGRATSFDRSTLGLDRVFAAIYHP